MNRKKPNIFTENNNQEYQWNQNGKSLAITNRILSFLVMPVFWLALGVLIIIREIQLNAVSFAGLLLILLSVLIVLTGLLIFINNSFTNISNNRTAEERHDFLLYRYIHGYGRSGRLKNRTLLMMAQMDLETGNEKRAETTLLQIQTEKLPGRELKIYDLFWFALSYEEDSDQTQDWYVRYAGLSDEHNEFPGNEVVKEWIDEKVDPKEIIEVISGICIENRYSSLPSLLFCILLGHCIFFFALKVFPGPGWKMRSAYETVSGCLTGLFLLILGVWILGKVIHAEKINREKTTGYRIRSVIGGIAWILFVCLLSVWTFLATGFDTDGKEIILKKNVRDAQNHITYTYLKAENESSTEYYRSPDFMMMEEWQEAMLYDTRSSSKKETDDTPTSTVTPSATPDTSDPDTAVDDGFVSQNAMQRVYEYLEDHNTYGNLSITFNANAKGDLYALIQKGTETDGTTYELCLYDNGIKDSQNEIVLEKVYPDGNRDTELMDFYLVDGKGNITDEQKTTW